MKKFKLILLLEIEEKNGNIKDWGMYKGD